MLQLYQNIRKYRLEKRLSQTDLAKLTGYADKSMISRIENGLIDLPQSQIFNFAKALDVTATELFGNEGAAYTEEEDNIIQHYRWADDGIKRAIRKLLNMED